MTAFNPAATAFTFPGQGSQFVGMLAEQAAAQPLIAETLAEADDVLGFALSALIRTGPETMLNDTVNTQPALLAASIACLRAFRAEQGAWIPAFFAGHSVGEVAALVAAEALTFADGLRLVRRRGEVMKAAGERAPGGMAAMLGLDAPVLDEVCAEARALTGGVVQVANDNCPGQVVISGEVAALEKAMELAKARGAKRAMRLPVSIAAHSPLMQSGVEEYAAFVNTLAIQPPAAPVISNITAQPLPDVAAIRAELPQQLVTQVRWTDSVRYLLAQGVTTFVELGPKDVLTNLLKRIDPAAIGVKTG